MKKTNRRRNLRAMLIIVVILGIVVAAGWWALSNLGGGVGIGKKAAEDYPGPGTGEVSVTVDPDDIGSDIGQKLFEAGVVKSSQAFVKAFTDNAAALTIKPGTYTMRLEMSAAQALAFLLDEANRSDNTVTVIPGQTVAQVVEKMEDVAGFSSEDIKAAMANPEALGLPAEAGGILEGWLWAGAYEIATGDTPETVLKDMIGKTVAFMEGSGAPRDQWETILTKASIIEREVQWEEHMPKVARVIENRLADVDGETRGMLQMDSTVAYGVGRYGGIPSSEEMADDNPYNTYMHAGLPPSPIASPSEAAINAALNPEEGNWLYFVTINLETGETLFADSYDQTLEDTKKLTEWCAANPGKC